MNINTFTYQVNFVPPVIFVPEDFCDAFCVAGGAFGRPVTAH